MAPHPRYDYPYLFFSDMLYSLSSAHPVLLSFLKRWMRKNLGFAAHVGLWKQTQSCLGLDKVTGTSRWISMDSFSFSLLFKEDDFSPKSEAQSFIRFGPLDEMDER